MIALAYKLIIFAYKLIRFLMNSWLHFKRNA